jgi:hypothetical protein
VTIKYTLNFRSVDGGAWSEDYWSNFASVATIGQVGAAAVNKRLAFLSPTCIWEDIRAADDTGLRVTKYQDVNKQGSFITLTVPGPDQLASDVAIVLEISSAQPPISTRRLWCRGLNDAFFTINPQGVQTLQNGVLGLIVSWIKDRVGQGWGIKRLAKTRLVPPAVTPVTTVDGSITLGHTLVTCLAPHNLANGDECIMYRQSKKDLPGLAGHWIVEAPITQTTFYVPYTTPGNKGPIQAGGIVRKAVYDPVQLFDPNSVRLLHVYHHDTRDAFFGSRGNRRASRLRRSP